MSTGEIFGRVVELLRFHSMDRKLYHRLVWGLHQARSNARRCLTLWKWLESIGHDNLIKAANFMPDSLLLAFFTEGLICHDVVMGLPPRLPPYFFPVTAALISEPIDLGFFIFHADLIKQGLDHIAESVGNVIFDDNLQLVVYDNGSPVAYIFPTVGWMEASGGSRLPAAGGAVKFALPDAEALFRRACEAIDRRLEPESEKLKRRSAFIVVSEESPIRREEIIEYFTSRFGNCLESVEMELGVGWGRVAVHGRMVFLSLRRMLKAMRGKAWALYHIRGSFLWARMCTQPQGYGLVEDEEPGGWI